MFLAATADVQLIELHPLDWLVIGIYAMITFAIAFWAMTKIHDTGGLLLGKRKMGKLMMMAAQFAGGTNANHPIGVSAAAYQSGLPGVWISLTWMLITPFFWMYPPAVRRLRIVTLIDLVRMRYGHAMAMIFKIVTVITFPISMGLGIKSAAVVLEVMTGDAFVHLAQQMGIENPAIQANMAELFAAAAIAIPTLIYTVMGGVIAAYATDVFQGLLIILLSFLLIPYAVVQAGGVEQLNGSIDQSFTGLFSSKQADFGVWWIIWFAVGIVFSASTSAVGGALAARNEMDSRMGLFGLITKRFCTIGWGLVGMLALVLYANHGEYNAALSEDANKVFAVASGDLLPVALRGLMVASILAAVMSSLDAALLGFGGMLVNNFYQEHFVKGASPKHYLLMTRIFATVGLIIGALVAWSITDIVEFMTIVEPLGGITGITIFVALVWRRVTGYGAIAAVLVVAPLFLAVNKPDWAIPFTHLINGGTSWNLFETMNLHPVADWMVSLYGLDPVNYIDPATGYFTSLPVQVKYPMYLIPTLAVLIGVSLVSKQHNKRAVDEFYCRLDTPVGEEHLIREAGFEVDQLERLSEEVEIGQKTSERRQRLLFPDFLYLPKLLWTGEAKLSDYKWDWIGVIGSIVFVLLFLWGVNWIGWWLFAAR